MRFPLLSREEPDGHFYATEVEAVSKQFPEVRFVLRRCSLARRISLMERLATHASAYEALKASERMDDRVQAEALRLRMDFEYLDWGLSRIVGLQIDGEIPDARMLFEKGPETLTQEILSRIREECELSGDERKN